MKVIVFCPDLQKIRAWFEVEYAVSLGVPVLVHGENGPSEWIFQYSFPFCEQKQGFLLSWEGFFHKIRFELGGSS